MKQLILKYLAPYLPYKLRIMYGKRNCVMIMLSGSSNNWIGIHSIINRQWNEKYPIKPILHPLSDLTKEIVHNGEPFIPIEEVQMHHDFSILKTDKLEKHPLRYPYTVIQKLFEWHFDIFGLIENNLAIDINTL